MKPSVRSRCWSPRTSQDGSSEPAQDAVRSSSEVPRADLGREWKPFEVVGDQVGDVAGPLDPTAVDECARSASHCVPPVTYDFRRAAGSRSARHRPRASAEILAYFPTERTETCPDIAISMGVDAPSSAAWVSAECRS
jgi:hypothetical protein